VVPLRTVVAAVPGTFGRLPSDSSGNSIGLYYPVLGRFQHVASGHGNGGQGSQASGEHHAAGVQTDQPPTLEPAVHRQNTEQRTRDGNVTILQFNEVTRITWFMKSCKFLVVGISSSASSGGLKGDVMVRLMFTCVSVGGFTCGAANGG